MAVKGTIVKVSGPLIVASGMADVNMYDVVRVSEKQLIGEVIELRGDKASIQVYEETGGIGPGEPVESTGAPLSVELAPGLIESIYDGIQRPLNKIQELAGDRITRGIRVDSIDHERLWDFQPAAQIGDILKPGDILGTVQETEAVLHKIMVPPNVEGQLTWIHSGEANVVQTIAKLVTSKGETVELPMLQKWPVRIGRPYARKMAPTEPMITGQRQDGSSASACKVGRRGHNRIRGLRRAGQRDDRRSDGVPGAEGPPHRSFPYEAHGAYSKHLGYAGCGP